MGRAQERSLAACLLEDWCCCSRKLLLPRSQEEQLPIIDPRQASAQVTLRLCCVSSLTLLAVVPPCRCGGCQRWWRSTRCAATGAASGRPRSRPSTRSCPASCALFDGKVCFTLHPFMQASLLAVSYIVPYHASPAPVFELAGHMPLSHSLLVRRRQRRGRLARFRTPVKT